MSLHCWTSRSWRFLAASSIFASWVLGRFGLMGPGARAPSSFSSGPVLGVATSRIAGPFWSKNSSSVWARLCNRCQRSATCTASGAPLAR